MPLIVPVELPTAAVVVVVPAELPFPDVVIVAPEGAGRVMIFIDPRVPFAIGADVVMRVRWAMYEAGDTLADLATMVQGVGYALG